MEREKFEKITLDLAQRLNLTVGINPMTNEKGIKINEIPTEYDVEFIKENRDEIIDILEQKELDEVEEKVELKISVDNKTYAALLNASKALDIEIEEYILHLIKQKS